MGCTEAFRPPQGNVHSDKFYSQTVKLSNRQTVKPSNELIGKDGGEGAVES